MGSGNVSLLSGIKSQRRNLNFGFAFFCIGKFRECLEETLGGKHARIRMDDGTDIGIAELMEHAVARIRKSDSSVDVGFNPESEIGGRKVGTMFREAKYSFLHPSQAYSIQKASRLFRSRQGEYRSRFLKECLGRGVVFDRRKVVF